MVDKEKIPIVEHLPSEEQPAPNTDGMPDDSEAHPGGDLEHQPIRDGGKIVGLPYEGYGQKIQTVPSPEEVEKMLGQATGESGRWLGEFLRRLMGKEERPKAG